jgi:hypothetical protein
MKQRSGKGICEHRCMNQTKVLANGKLGGQDQATFSACSCLRESNAGSFSTMQIRRRTQISLSPDLAAGVLVPVVVVPAA